MEANWIEIKRFLKDYKNEILIGSIIISIVFTVLIYIMGMFKAETQQDEKEDFEVDSEELLNNAQPAYFQLYAEYEDGISYGNASIINQYFNLSSVKDNIKQETGIDIKSIEEEIFLSDLIDGIEPISVTRNESSYLLTATFNLGSEPDNLTVAEYYYNLLYSEEFSILEDKKVYIFQEPILSKKSKLDLDVAKLEEKRKETEDYSLIKEILVHLKNIIIGFLLGIVLMIGIFLLKVLFGNTLDYTFAYDLNESDKFMLYDKLLKNENIISEFVAAPFGNHKLILSEREIDKKDIKLLTANEYTTTKRRDENLVLLDLCKSLTELNFSDDIAEVIIVIYPSITTRKWYRNQKWLAEINGLTTKVIQINR